MLHAPRARARRSRSRGPGRGAWLLVLVLAAGGVAGFLVLRNVGDHGRATAQRFASAWARGDYAAMWRLTDARSQARYPLRAFVARYAAASRAAGVQRVRVGRAAKPEAGQGAVRVAATTRLFGVLRGTVRLPVSGDDEAARVSWSPHLVLPRLRAGERVRRVRDRPPQRASILAAGGRRLDATASGASIAGVPARGRARATGLQRLYDARLGGHPATRLRFGERVVARVPAQKGRPVHTTIRPGLQAAADAALGARLGGVALVRPRDGAVLALAGLAVSAPQPPGSTFKIITLSGALQARLATPGSTFPVRTFATLSGVKLRNASDESCGGTLTAAFIVSCNSVFAPLGARLGATRLVRTAEAFGFNEESKVPAAKPSTIPAASQLTDALAVGASAIGQDRDLATPLVMAGVGATIANLGVHVRPRLVTSEPVARRRAVRRTVARQVRTMMLGVVRSGTGTAAAIPGVQVAGKTGTAELRPTAGGPPDPKNTDAWFVAFAPASQPRFAVAVMLIGAGAGGKAAAPIARSVLQAALAAG